MRQYSLLLLILVYPPMSWSGCREAQLPRDCETLCNFDQQGQVINCELRAAVLLPADSRYEISLFKVLPVLGEYFSTDRCCSTIFPNFNSHRSLLRPLIDMAVYAARSLKLLPHWLKLTFLAQDDGCDATYAQIGAIDNYSKCVHVFFGPTCDYCVASVGRITKFLNAPLITTGGFTFDFTKKKKTCQDEYFMTIRMGNLAFRDIALFLIDILDEYAWKKIHLLYDTNGQAKVAGRHTCQLMMKSIVEYIKKRRDLEYGTFDLDATKISDYPQILKEHVGTSYAGKFSVISSLKKIYFLIQVSCRTQ
ncbi:unnamed protein product [Trichogramma brassicae]|uniref:Receptor ligand binding region domain-containing protein n=1 Tax=Trichogramma brassicae TaxID=86971 RepID=A0A6H5IBG5_9HYME|nr:unnamed protein product [Trichogramma brassicae]